MRRIGLILTVLASALVLALLSGTGAASGLGDVRFFSGDANCDDRIDSLDALLVLQFEAGLVDQLIFPESADSNKDGKIDSSDAQLILQFDAGLMPDKMPNFCLRISGEDKED